MGQVVDQLGDGDIAAMEGIKIHPTYFLRALGDRLRGDQHSAGR